jgi:ABC-type oligopeptide transport system substrate-binding subunit
MGKTAARVAGFAFCMLLAASAAGCSDAASSDTSEVAPEAACTHFRTVVTDTAAGNVTESELRVEFERILDAAQAAGTAAMADAAQRVTAALAVGDMIAFEQAFRDMDAACSDAGF